MLALLLLKCLYYIYFSFIQSWNCWRNFQLQKTKKYNYLLKVHTFQIEKKLTWHFPQNVWSISVVFYSDWNLLVAVYTYGPSSTRVKNDICYKFQISWNTFFDAATTTAKFLCFRWTRTLDLGSALQKMLSDVFFILSPSITFPTIDPMFFFLNVFFSALPHSIFFGDIKHSGLMSFDFKFTVNISCLYSCHVYCILNVLRARCKMDGCSLGLPSWNKDINIIIINVFDNFGARFWAEVSAYLKVYCWSCIISVAAIYIEEWLGTSILQCASDASWKVLPSQHHC